MADKGVPDQGESLDTFWLREVYPDAAATLAFAQSSMEGIKETCMVALDANVLLLPYRLGATSLNEIKDLFASLAIADRIFLPAQAVREFLKHRATRIRDVLRELGNQASQIQVVADRRAGFLEADPGYQDLVNFSQQIKELKSLSLKTISQIGDRLRNGVGLDPVSSVYREIFGGRVVDLDGCISDEKLKEEMVWRYRHSIPPGYKDRNKPDEGIGDFLIWKTILQLAVGRKMDCIFVTEDAKSDWWVQSEGIFQPRLELVDEYRRASDGKTLHLLPLSGLLQLLGAQSDTVDEARQAEKARKQQLLDEAERARSAVLLMREENDRREGDLVSLTRAELARDFEQLTEDWRTANRERISIDQILRNASATSEMSDADVSALYHKRDELESITRETIRRRTQVERRIRDIVTADEG